MAEFPLISIVVITYNSAKFILEALESAKNQTYTNIELIISDDASNDDTVSICKNWIIENKNRFVNIRLITAKENSGIPSNCNRGIKATSGIWLKLIAGDDILLNNCIEDNINFVRSNKNCSILFSKLRKFVRLNDRFSGGDLLPQHTNFFELDNCDQYKELLIEDRISNTPTAFIKAELFSNLNFLDEEFRLIEDYPFWLKVTKNGYKLFFMDIVTVLYRLHEDSVYQGEALNNNLVDKVNFRNEELRKKYVYPEYCLYGKCKYRYSWFINSLFIDLKNNWTNRLVYKIISFYTNPFTYVEYIFKNLLPRKQLYLKQKVNCSTTINNKKEI